MLHKLDVTVDLHLIQNLSHPQLYVWSLLYSLTGCVLELHILHVRMYIHNVKFYDISEVGTCTSA